MTGILPIKKYGEHSALNMFTEYSMTEPVPISEYMGFTTVEVQALSEAYGISYDMVQAWYDGYLIDEKKSTLFRIRNNIDLVFYNYILKCFVLIDLKVGSDASGPGTDADVCSLL